ncbi:hypothetical protein AAFN85_02090 [Mucilaginibacter sp. CAU 1740]|uniref:hypothetical protein n=1 Tax=Mucilaginibacter sp. CAU 1740 TaxID=3140365 RepID=UPI00325B195E
MWRLFLVILLLPTIAKSQGANAKKDTILLRYFNKGDTLVYDLGHNKLYLELRLVLKYLKNYRGANVYNKQGITLLSKALKHTKNGIFYLQDTLVFDQQTGLIDTASLQNKYIGAIDKIIPKMLTDGQVMIRDNKHNQPIPYLLVTTTENGNYFGAFIEFSAFLPNGKRLCRLIFYKD